MAKQKTLDAAEGIETICRNRRASHDYEIHDTLECGVVLVGTEVKSLRAGHANLEDAYARVDDGELWLHGAEIPQYTYGNRQNHEPKRSRKLLLHKREIAKFAGKASEKGFTLVPTRLYFRKGKAKVEIAVGRGKVAYDKRESTKAKEAKRDMDRAIAKQNRR